MRPIPAQAHGWLQACLQEVSRQDREGGGGDERASEVERLCMEITRAPGHVRRVREMARLLHLSPDHFTRLFKQVKGMPPREYLIRARIDAARGLLLSSTHSIGRIAEITGYADIYHFSRQFRERTGVSPSRYRGVH